ncbi:MAG: glycerol dehydrogenase [Solirubrobacterales bacterium]|nr:glycerol dehydrogenase [Solirubrobacterales bacterium]
MPSDLAVFAAPGRYVQGRGAVATLGSELERLKVAKPLILLDPGVRDVIGSAFTGLADARVVDFSGECSPGEIDRVAAIASDFGADVVVGVGGGKALDTAKAVAHPADLPLVIVPTIASTDAPTSALSVIYDDDGAFLEYRFWGGNPDVVLVDTDVIAKAPVRFLVAGIGDGLSTWFEADASSTTRAPAMAGGAPLQAALTLARLCYDTLLEHGVPARQAVERKVVTRAVERVVEANTLLSGLGFESGGLAAAHSIHNGLTVLHETHGFWHGEKVAFGVISMVVLEGRPTAVLQELVDFCLEVGLPVTLGDLGVDPDEVDLGKVAEAACAEGETIHNLPFAVDEAMVVDAMLAADVYGQERRALLERSRLLPEVAA